MHPSYTQTLANLSAPLYLQQESGFGPLNALHKTCITDLPYTNTHGMIIFALGLDLKHVRILLPFPGSDKCRQNTLA